MVDRNYGFSIMCKINGILGVNDETLGEEDPALDSNDVTLFKCAPLTSRDVVRASPSTRKYYVTIADHFYLKMHLVIHCNVARHED
jgi:hypothetical protein